MNKGKIQCKIIHETNLNLGKEMDQNKRSITFRDTCTKRNKFALEKLWAYSTHITLSLDNAHG